MLLQRWENLGDVAWGGPGGVVGMLVGGDWWWAWNVELCFFSSPSFLKETLKLDGEG